MMWFIVFFLFLKTNIELWLINSTKCIRFLQFEEHILDDMKAIKEPRGYITSIKKNCSNATYEPYSRNKNNLVHKTNKLAMFPLNIMLFLKRQILQMICSQPNYNFVS
jgi:hypothetical protein